MGLKRAEGMRPGSLLSKQNRAFSSTFWKRTFWMIEDGVFGKFGHLKYHPLPLRHLFLHGDITTISIVGSRARDSRER